MNYEGKEKDEFATSDFTRTKINVIQCNSVILTVSGALNGERKRRKHLF